MPVEIREGFDVDGQEIAGWTQNRGSWRVTDGSLSTDGNVSNRSITRTDLVLADSFALSADIAIDAVDNLWSGLAAHVSGNSTEMLSFRLAKRGSGALWQFLEIKSQKVYAAGTLSSEFQAGESYRISLNSTGYGEYTFDLRDSTRSLLLQSGSKETGPRSFSLPPEATLAGGSAGLFSGVGGVSFDNVALSTSLFGTVATGDALASAKAFDADWTRKQRTWTVEDGSAVGAGANATAANTRVSLGSAFQVSTEITVEPSSSAVFQGVAFNVSKSFDDQYVFRFRNNSLSSPLWQLIRQQPSKTPGSPAESVIASGILSEAVPAGKPYTLGVRTVDLDHVALFVRAVDAPSDSNLVKVDERIAALPIEDRLVGGHAGIYSHYSTARFTNARIATTSDQPAALTDRFDGPDTTDIVSSWRKGSYGDWRVQGGALTAIPTNAGLGAQQAVTQQHVELSGGAFRVRADFEVGAELSNAWKGIRFNLRNLGKTAETGAPQQYYSFRFRDSSNLWQLVRSDAGQSPGEVELARGSATLNASGTYTFDVASSAPGTFRLSISRDGAQVIAPVEVVDDAPIVGGAVGLFATVNAAQQSQRMDNFSVVSSHSAGAPLVAATSCVGTTLAHNPVGQTVLTRDGRQYVAYYGADRYMRVASRSLSDTASSAACVDGEPAPGWLTKKLEARVPDNAHNYVTMAFDSDGQLHVIGNLRSSGLDEDLTTDEYDKGAYYRTTKAGDITTLERQMKLASREWSSALTYPEFVTLHEPGASKAELVIHYRSRPGSGGCAYGGPAALTFDRYDTKSKKWEAHSAFTHPDHRIFPSKVLRGTDGVYRMAWVWRLDADVRTTSRVSYVESTDLKTWRTIEGQALPASFDRNLDAKGLVVDDVPEGVTNDVSTPGDSGVDNGLVSVTLQLDSKNNPVLLYTKLDEVGELQIYSARRDVASHSWSSRALTKGAGVAPMSGFGTLTSNAQIGQTAPYGQSQPYWITATYFYGPLNNHLIIDSRTGAAVADSPGEARVSPLDAGTSTNGLWFNGSADLGGVLADGRSWSLQWYSRPTNGDQIVTADGQPAPAGSKPSTVSVNPQPLWVYSTTR